jgi:hypothetical protein
MVRHQEVGQHRQIRPPAVLCQQPKLHLTVAPGVKDDLPAAATLSHVARHSRHYNSSRYGVLFSSVQ